MEIAWKGVGRGIAAQAGGLSHTCVVCWAQLAEAEKKHAEALAALKKTLEEKQVRSSVFCGIDTFDRSV